MLEAFLAGFILGAIAASGARFMWDSQKSGGGPGEEKSGGGPGEEKPK